LTDKAIGAARDLILFADGVQEGAGGFPELARRARVAARDVLELAEQLDAERSARVAMQKARDEALDVLRRRAGQAMAAA
jgi:hypothetical protein